MFLTLDFLQSFFSTFSRVPIKHPKEESNNVPLVTPVGIGLAGRVSWLGFKWILD